MRRSAGDGLPDPRLARIGWGVALLPHCPGSAVAEGEEEEEEEEAAKVKLEVGVLVHSSTKRVLAWIADTTRRKKKRRRSAGLGSCSAAFLTVFEEFLTFISSPVSAPAGVRVQRLWENFWFSCVKVYSVYESPIGRCCIRRNWLDRGYTPLRQFTEPLN